MRALAALEASSIAATMHADRDYWSATPAATTSIDDTIAAGAITSTDNTLTTSPNCYFGGSDAPCTPAKLAAADLQNWRTDMYNTLRGATSAIVCANVATVISCTITINWQENTAAANSQESANTFQNETYQLMVNP